MFERKNTPKLRKIYDMIEKQNVMKFGDKKLKGTGGK